jgi:hypothetical protein
MSDSSPDGYPPVAEYRFRAGPYCPPKMKKGGKLRDEWTGEQVEVAGMTEAPIPWPAVIYNVGLHKGLLPILCGDLVRAVVEEPEGVVAHYFGVTTHIVNRWKQALAGVKSSIRSSAEVYAALATKRFDPKFRKAFGYRS